MDKLRNGSGLITANEARAAADARESKLAHVQVRGVSATGSGGSWQSPREVQSECRANASTAEGLCGGGGKEEAARMAMATHAGPVYPVNVGSEELAGPAGVAGSGSGRYNLHHRYHHPSASAAGSGSSLQSLTSICRLPLMLMEHNQKRALSASRSRFVGAVGVPPATVSDGPGMMGGRWASVTAELMAAEERDPELQALLVRVQLKRVGSAF